VPYDRIPTSHAASLHPGIRHLVTNHPATPFALTDVLSERAWWDSELHSRMRPDWGKNYQFCIPVRAAAGPTTPVVWTLGREHTDVGSSPHSPTSRVVQQGLAAGKRGQP
jgi:hypothetical protein